MSKRRLIAAGWLAIIVLGIWLALTRTPISTDMTLFIPAMDDRSALLLEQLRAGPGTRLILIGLEGGTEQQRASTSQALAERLRASGRFLHVANGADTLDDAAQQSLMAQRYLLSPAITPERFSAAGLKTALEQRLRELASPLSAMTKRLLPADPTGEFLAMLQLWQTSQQPAKRQRVWFSPDGQRALLLAETAESGFDLDAQDQALAAIKQSFVASRQGPVQMLLSGPGVFGTLSQATIRAETQWLSGLASALLIILLWLVYRSPRIVLLGALPLLSAIVMGVTAVSLLFGGIYGITLAFGVTLLGVALDYPIHCFSHWYSPETLEQNLQRIWPTMRTGAITTAIGYLAMITADFEGLAQLGVFAIAGLLTAAAVTRWVLPTLVPATWNALPSHAVLPKAWLVPLLHPPRVIGLVLGMLGGSIAAMVIISTPQLWEDDLAALSPIPAELIQLDRELRAALGAPEAGHFIVITATDAETVLQRCEKLAKWLEMQVQQGALSSFDMAANYLPSLQTQRQRQAALPGRTSLEASLNEALEGLPFKPGLFIPFLNEVEAARMAPLLSPEDLSGTPLELRISPLLYEQPAGWRGLIPLSGVQADNRLAQALAEQNLPGVHYFDLKTETNRLISIFRDEALTRAAWGAALLIVVLALSLRSLRRLVFVLVPVSLAIVIDVAVLLALGKQLSLFHLVSLLLVMGLGIDYSLFFSRPEPVLARRARTLSAVLVCSGSTLTVFGMLALSALPVLQAIGQTVAIGVLTSFLMALILAQQTATPCDVPTEQR